MVQQVVQQAQTCDIFMHLQAFKLNSLDMIHKIFIWAKIAGFQEHSSERVLLILLGREMVLMVL